MNTTPKKTISPKINKWFSTNIVTSNRDGSELGFIVHRWICTRTILMSHNQLLAISIFPRFLPWDVRIPVRVIGAEGIVNMMQGVFVHGRCKLPSNIGGERTSCAIIIVMDVAVMTASIVYQRLPVLVVGHMPSLGTNALNLTRGSSISHRCVPVVKQPASGHVGARHFIIAWCMVKLRDGRGNRSPVGIMGGA